MLNVIRTAVGLIALAPLASTALAQADPQPKLEQSAGRARLAGDFRIEPASFNLGDVGHLERRVVEFKITNLNPTPLALDTPRPTCDCMKVTFDASRPLGPGESRTGEIQISLGRGYSKFDKSIRVQEKLKPGTARNIRVYAKYLPGIKVDTRQLKLYCTQSGPFVASVGTITVEKPGAEKLEVSKIDFSRRTGADLSVQKTGSGSRYQLVVTAKPTGKPGRIFAQLEFFVDSLKVAIPISGREFQQLAYLPDHFLFSRIEDRRTAKAEIRLFSPDGLDFKILNQKFEPGKRSTGILSLSASAHPEGGYRLIAKPAEPFPEQGSIRGTVVVMTDLASEPKIEIPVTGFFAPQR